MNFSQSLVLLMVLHQRAVCEQLSYQRKLQVIDRMVYYNLQRNDMLYVQRRKLGNIK